MIDRTGRNGLSRLRSDHDGSGPVVILHVRVVAGATEIRMDVPEAAFSVRIANVMTLEASGLISGFGDEARSRADAQLVPIYDATDFHPDRTFGFLRYHVATASSGLRRGLAHVLDLLDRVELELHLPQYERIPPDRRRRFERLLGSFVFARSYSINGAYRRLLPNLLRHF